MNLLCRLKIHKFSKWTPDSRDTKYDHRVCLREKCKKLERRKVI